MNITSEAGHLSPEGYNYLAYSVSKHGANMYTQKIRNYLTEEKADKNIRIYMVHPGRLDTIMGKEDSDLCLFHFSCSFLICKYGSCFQQAVRPAYGLSIRISRQAVP